MSGILLFLDISSGEILVIILVVMMLFGPKQIPVIARTIGKGLYELRKASDQIKREVMQEAGQIERVVKEPINSILSENDNKKPDRELITDADKPIPSSGENDSSSHSKTEKDI